MVIETKDAHGGIPVAKGKSTQCLVSQRKIIVFQQWRRIWGCASSLCFPAEEAEDHPFSYEA
jgi:hypothetical protein